MLVSSSSFAENCQIRSFQLLMLWSIVVIREKAVRSDCWSCRVLTARALDHLENINPTREHWAYHSWYSCKCTTYWQSIIWMRTFYVLILSYDILSSCFEGLLGYTFKSIKFYIPGKKAPWAGKLMDVLTVESSDWLGAVLWMVNEIDLMNF